VVCGSVSSNVFLEKQKKAMDEILQNLSSVYWWVSVVVVGLVINLLSSYLKPPLDALGGKTFHAVKARSERAKRLYDQKVSALSSNPHAQVIAMLRAQSLRAKSNGWSLTAILALMLSLTSPWMGAPTPPMLPGALRLLNIGFIVSVVLSMRLAYAAADLEVLVIDAQAASSSDSAP